MVIIRKQKKRGFTLIEISIVMAIISILYFAAMPLYTDSGLKAREAVLKKDLHVLRSALDNYYKYTGSYPSDLNKLVEEKYIRSLPEDPITGNRDWITVPHDNGGIYDIHSASTKYSTEGTQYSGW
jgi:general secretion pathway protein G